MTRILKFVALTALGALFAMSAMPAETVTPMYGGVLIDGYDFGKDIGPKGTIAYDPAKNEFKGSYNGLKMPPGRRAIFAWVHDSVNQKSRYVGPVGWLKKGTAGKNKGFFTIAAPEEFKGGNFGTYEIIAFSAENTDYLDGAKVVTQPKEPSGSQIQRELKPAFYLFGALPGADTQLQYCGHGQDFTLVKAPEKQTCYD